VYGIGYERPYVYGAEEVGDFRSENLQKFYFPNMPKGPDDGTVIFKNAYVVYWSLTEDKLSNRVYGLDAGAIFGYNYVENDYWVKDYLPRFIANVSYLYNYDYAPNEGYYWVDSYNESIITFIPPEPEREGYSFDGWYKEEECINAWDFTTDITGKEIKMEENKVYDTYEGIYLYAKWIEE
ncbi:MAG: InlB B-repeat-containing protein, partial [Clostridia bacterium]|nr:InlB B-repeat-containing protein [Clostridia bacterium]